MFYCSENVCNKIEPELRSFNLDIWLAKYYTNKPTNFEDDNAVVQSRNYKGVSNIRQYSQSGVVNGYDELVDLNLCYDNIPKLIRNANLNYQDDFNSKIKKLFN